MTVYVMTDSHKLFHQQSRFTSSCSFIYSAKLFMTTGLGRGGVLNTGLKMLVCALFLLLTCPCVWADTHIGFSVDTGDQKVSWVGKNERSADRQRAGGMNLLVTEDQQVEKADRWNPKYDTDIDYGEYIKSFKLYLVIKKAF